MSGPGGRWTSQRGKLDGTCLECGAAGSESPVRVRWVRAAAMKARWDLVLLPPLVISLVLLLASQLVFLKGSLQHDLGMGVMAPGPTLDNFQEIFTDPYFVSSLWLSLSVSTVAMVITLLIAFPAAYAIARMDGQLSIVLLSAVVVSSFLSIVVKVLGLLLIFSSSGPLNRTLFWLGAISEPVTIVGNVPGVILGLIYYTLGFAILLFYSIVVTVPRSLEEAAEVHGASRAGVFRQVVMPLCLPGIAAGALMIFNVNMGGFSSTALIGAGKILTLPIVIQRTVILETNYGLGAALAVLLLVVVLVINAFSVLLLLRARRGMIV